MEKIKRLKRKNRKRTTKDWSKFINTHLKLMVDFKNHSETNKGIEIKYLNELINNFIESYNRDD